MSRRTQGETTARIAILVVALLIPALTLIPLGSLWLWQHGLLYYWAAAALLVVAVVYGLQRRIFPAATAKKAAEDARSAFDDEQSAKETLGWSPIEEQAWADVKLLARNTDPGTIASRDDLFKLAQVTVETVAKRIHPEEKDPLWQFTLPEAFALSERVSRRLRMIASEQIPFGDRMTVAQALDIYRWRGAVDLAEKAYDIWRVLRLANPIAAATQEARERMSKALLQWGRDHISRRMIETYVLEVGRAAIDLYGGRLRVSAEVIKDYVSPDSAADVAAIAQARAEPLRILIAGQVGVGKSSLVNALAQRAKAAVDVLPATAKFTPYALERDGFPAALLVDSPGLAGDKDQIDATIERAADCDLVLWVVGAHRADRHIDSTGLGALRAHFATRLNRRRPPLILVLTHIDRLRPFDEWQPPYDLEKGEDPKSVNIRSAVAAAATDLGFDADEAVPVSMVDSAKPYNFEALWLRIAETLPEATRAQLLRCLHELRDEWSWSKLWSQTASAGRSIAKAVRGQPSQVN